MALVDDLRKLALVLPPSFRLAGAEVADIAGALVEVVAHGGPDGPLLKAATEGGAQGVADFYHQHIADNRPDGAPEPEKGAPVENVPLTAGSAPNAGVSQSDFAQLLSAVQALAANQQQLAQQLAGHDAPAPTAPTPPSPAPEAPASPAPAPGDTDPDLSAPEA